VDGVYTSHAGATTVAMFAVSMLLSLVILIINVFVIIYLDRLEKTGCACAKDWRRMFAFVFLIMSIAYTVFMAVMTFAVPPSSVGDTARHWLRVAIMAFIFVMSIAAVLNVIFSLQYIHRLRDQKCACSRDLTRDVWEILLYIYVAFIALGLLQALVLIITMDRSVTASFDAWNKKGAPTPSILPQQPRKTLSAAKPSSGISNSGSRPSSARK